MTLVRLPVVPAAALALTLAAPVMTRAQVPASSVYTLDRSSSIVGFTMYASALFKIKQDGYFKDFSGLVAYDPTRPADTRMDLTVVAASVDTRNSSHDELLRSGEFFDVEHYPTIHFASESANVQPDGTLSVTGDMTIRGVTRRMTIPVTLRRTALAGTTQGAALESTFQIDRTEFGLNGGASRHGFHVSISKKVQIHLNIATRLDSTHLSR